MRWTVIKHRMLPAEYLQVGVKWRDRELLAAIAWENTCLIPTSKSSYLNTFITAKHFYLAGYCCRDGFLHRYGHLPWSPRSLQKEAGSCLYSSGSGFSHSLHGNVQKFGVCSWRRACKLQEDSFSVIKWPWFFWRLEMAISGGWDGLGFSGG